MLRVKRWSRPAYAAFSLLFIAIMCFTLLPSPVQIGPLSFGGAGVASALGTCTANQSYTTGDDDTSSVYGVNWNAETFTPSANHDVGCVKLKLSRGGNGGGTLTVGIRACTTNVPATGKPTGSDLASGTLDSSTVTTDAAGAWYTIILSSTAAVTSGILYAIVVRVPSGDVTNHLHWRDDSTSPSYAGGAYNGSGDSGSTWTIYTTHELLFEEGVYTALTIATLATTSITVSAATLNGNITALGSGGNATLVGFAWGTTPVSPTPDNVTPPNAGYNVGNWTSDAVNYGVGIFDSDSHVTGLISGKIYYARAGAYNSTDGWVWSTTEIAFQTLPGVNFLAGNTHRIKVETIGSSAITGDAEMFDVAYNGAFTAADSCTQFLYRPATRYVGTHDRTYIAGADSTGAIYIRQWDEDDLTLSNTVPLWGASSQEDHNGCSVIVLQHQTGGLASENGTILTVGTQIGVPLLASRRSDNSEDITSWGDSVTLFNSYFSCYPQLIELGNGTIYCFSMDVGSSTMKVYRRTLTLNTSDPTNDSWSAATVVAHLGSGDHLYTYPKVWFDGTDIHFIFSAYYKDVYYIKYQTSDGTWRSADGTQKYLPLDNSVGNQTPDLIYDTPADHTSVIMDIKTDGSNNPYLLWSLEHDGEIASWALDSHGDIYRSYYSAGWNNVDTGVDVVRFGSGAGSDSWMSMADFDEGNPDVIYAGVPDGSNNSQIEAWENVGGTWYIANGSNGTTAIATDGKITQGSPGDNFRPIHVLNGAGHFEFLWFYTEDYISTSVWSSMRMAYPGFSNQNFLCLNKLSRTDFGELRLTQGDGSTLQPSASSGAPWIQEKTDSWRAILWWKVGDVPASTTGKLINYVYYGNSTNTNANTQATMDSQFLAADGFDNGTTLDTDKWTMTNTVTVASGNLVLTGVASNQGLILQKAANYPLFTYGEVRFRAKGNDTAVGNSGDIGFTATSTLNDSESYLWMNTANRLIAANCAAGSCNIPTLDGMDTANWHNLSITWVSGHVYFCTDLNSVTSRTIPVLKAYPATYVSTVAQGLYALEPDADSGIVYVDWIFARPFPSATVSALTQELIDISNTPSLWSVGVVQPSQTYWANSAEPSWPLTTGDCWGNLTNNSSFVVDISASMTNMTGGTTWSIGSNPGTNVFTLKIGIAGLAGVGNFTTLSGTPVAWITNMAAGNMTRWTMVFYTPTNSPQFADGTPKSGNMTFEAEAS